MRVRNKKREEMKHLMAIEIINNNHNINSNNTNKNRYFLSNN